MSEENGFNLTGEVESEIEKAAEYTIDEAKAEIIKLRSDVKYLASRFMHPSESLPSEKES